MSPNTGDVIAERFTIQRLLGKGAFGSVWLASDQARGKRCVIKLYPKESANAPFHQYKQYLHELQRGLSGYGFTRVSLPIEVGETEDYAYQVSEYFEDFLSLDQVLLMSGPLDPRDALLTLSQIARAIADLHSHSVIHADLKPANVLVSQGPERQVRIIDFGMVQPVEAEEGVLVFGTYLYLHPELVTSTRETNASTAARMEVRAAAIGSYIDIYSMGITAVEILTTKPSLPRPLSEASLAALLKEANPWLRTSEEKRVDAVVNLLFQMVSVRPRQEGISARIVGSLAESLASLFPTHDLRTDVNVPSEPEVSGQPHVIEEVASALHRIELVGKQLAEQTAAFILKSGTVQSIPSADEDKRILAEVNSVFRSAIDRTRTSWRLGVAMTITSFAVLVSMIISAVTLTILTGKAHWGILFGGIGISTVIGTLIWRPYDRLFRATILTQQIEMIHVQTVAGFRGTLNMEGAYALMSRSRGRASGPR